MAQSVDGCPSNRSIGRTTFKIVDIIFKELLRQLWDFVSGWAKIWFLMRLNKFIQDKYYTSFKSRFLVRILQVV